MKDEDWGASEAFRLQAARELMTTREDNSTERIAGALRAIAYLGLALTEGNDDERTCNNLENQ